MRRHDWHCLDMDVRVLMDQSLGLKELRRVRNIRKKCKKRGTKIKLLPCTL